MLKLSGVMKIYRGKKSQVVALDRFSHDFSPGKLHIVCGESGSGKSTLLMIAGGMMPPEEGEVFFNETSIYAQVGAWMNNFRNRNVGFVFQKFHLLPYFNVKKNILLPQLIQKDERPVADSLRIIEMLRLSDRLDHYPSELSVGQQQRTAVARALASSPDLILADEPTGNLDSENAKIIAGVLKNQAEQGKTVVVVTHDRSLIDLGDELLQLKSGIVVK